MKRFNPDKLEPALILGVRNLKEKDTAISKGIRAIVNSYTNHTTMIIKLNTNGFVIAEVHPPKAKKVQLSHYEDMMNEGFIDVRVWRIPNITDAERKRIGYVWQSDVDGKDYDEISVLRLWVMRFVNSLPYRIKGEWCTRAVGHCLGKVLNPENNPFRKPLTDPIKIKKNETPRTPENRLACGFLTDVTNEVIIDIK